MRTCHSLPPPKSQTYKKHLRAERRYHRKVEQCSGTHWYTTPWQWLRMLQHNRGEREREFGNERERDECSGILRSEGKSPLVLVLLERLALTHEYFILLMFKSHHLWCSMWACVEIQWNEEKEECVYTYMCVCASVRQRGRVCWSIMHSLSKFTCDRVYCACVSVLWKKWMCLCLFVCLEAQITLR